MGYDHGIQIVKKGWYIAKSYLEKNYQNAQIYLKTTTCHLMNEFCQNMNWFKLSFSHLLKSYKIKLTASLNVFIPEDALSIKKDNASSPFFIQRCIIHLDELWQTIVVRLVIRL